MASFDDVCHDEFEVNGVIFHLGSSSEIPSLVIDQFDTGSQSPTLSSTSATTSSPLVVSMKASPFHQDAVTRVVSNVDDSNYCLQDLQNRAFCASATLVSTQAEIEDLTDESDIEAFLEYARDVVAYNNAPYDPDSFQDFEQLVGECIVRSFGNDDDIDKDSLASDMGSAFSGYDHETGVLSYRHKQMLEKPLISELAANRIKGVIAQKKKDEQALTTINGSFVPPRSYRRRIAVTKPDVDTSDDSMASATIATISLQSLNQSRVSREERKFRSSPKSNDSDSSENEISPPRKRPKQRCRMRKTRKQRRELPPRSRCSKDGEIGNPCNRSTHESPSASRINISTILSCSPVEKERVLRYLKEFAPQLYKTVVERMEEEDRAGTAQLERGYHNDSGFLGTPERPVHRGPADRIVKSVIPDVTLHKYRFPPTSKRETPSWKPSIDTSSVLRPSNVKAGITFNSIAASSDLPKTSNPHDHVRLSLTEDIERVLEGMLEKQKLMKSHSCYLPEMIEDGRELNRENLTVRGMAVIHKFRAKKKAVLQAKFLQQSQECQPLSPSPPNSASSGSIKEDNRSPHQLESYMTQAQSSTGSKSPRSSPISSLEGRRQKIRRLKENRRRLSMPLNNQVKESRASLLLAEPLPSNDEPEKSSLSSDGLSSKSKASPFRHVKFPMQKKKDSNYEALTPESSHVSVAKSVNEGGSECCSPLLKYSSSLSSSTSSSGNSQRNNSFFAGGLNSDDINKIIIDPQSPEYLSPIRNSRTWQMTDDSNTFANGLISEGFSDTNTRAICDLSDVSNRFPTIFDEHGTSTGQSMNTSSWSEMSFQSDLIRFPLSSPRKHQQKLSKSKGLSKGVSIQAISKRITKVVATESTELRSGYNDSFDEIVSRETPSHNNRVSPGGVMDVFFQSQLQCKEKNDFLSFVDEEDESDILFTDKEDDSFSAAAAYGFPLQEAVFLTNSRFEI
jgi:hypothetical protein